MQSITLSDVLPRVFADRSDIRSQVWRTDLRLESGKKYLIMAESGGGKSSLCAYIYGYRTDYEGTIRFDNRSIGELSIAEWCNVRRNDIAYLPQELRLFPELTALENVELKNRLSRHKTSEQIAEMFDRLGIADKLNSPVGKLSIGQQQRVAIIRTLCQPCSFFLLDEPVSHLDAANNSIVARMVTEEAERLGAGIIATSVGNNLDINAEEVLRL
ncbi:MAG: ATP-binding cassette domain-containing protein [Bacteroidales bacterium]|nr:ATP-binding cassette domain-containing protein [Bacteroidales bacterium]MDY4942373.1 ATP-binding cassette domain-containing protein [Candidatus Limisoma sp.]MDD7760746.1 ATP-binding cassette domain-containing protein [Bacteroidales bacterium]MDY5899677.1 ATP-binding cassette domain-containing protein [Candidatus Limisoma sp.]MDY6000146.1 ATP-binding cassette domain-containing protein [Candidatus Limisoma sp.]